MLHQEALESVPVVGDIGFHPLVMVASARFLRCTATILSLCHSYMIGDEIL